jgi:ParB-like chromosome segregation protein Spo0J
VTLTIERVKLDALVLDPANARTHDKRNLNAIRHSLEKFGQTRPLVVSEDLTVLAGNGTVEAMRSLGWTEALVTRVPFATPEEARAFALTDNRSSELAQWNKPVLLEALHELSLAGWQIEELGFRAEDLAAYRRREDKDAPADFPSYGDDIETEFCCPGCGYEWSGRRE